MSLLARALCTDTVRSLDIHNLQQHVSVENRFSQVSESSFRMEVLHSNLLKATELKPFKRNLKFAFLIWVIITERLTNTKVSFRERPQSSVRLVRTQFF